MPELALWGWIALGVGAFLVGFAKTAIGGLVSVAVAIYAAVLPTRLSTGTLLILLIMGDIVAVSVYRRDVDWRSLWRVLPPVVAGLVVGTIFLGKVDDTTLRRTIGIMLLVLVGLHFLVAGLNRRRRPPAASPPQGEQPAQGGGSSQVAGAAGAGSPVAGPGKPNRFSAGWLRYWAAQLGYGVAAGFTTMTANSGGTVMTLYWVNARFSMMRFLGTAAWFYFIVNLIKLPFSAGLGLITPSQLLLCAALCPVVLLGTWLGRAVISRLRESWFNNLVVIAGAVPAVFLLF